ncbi:M20/M25/M40 family metallo-hydrolase [Sandaracinomonas limnophila]|uniref:M20/M25/M40 family metallo-hydrolase n=1 Tax=Sandaracinomonas limnophila TaxID=1862386 RepID=A0A437PMK2_9BACT|nr:M20 family metallo-hydrolase [Sandaracinomonas limnophila]RVU23495.1 M20/M25/M40 family metallo-hydrolase [Sandaracinomonas limnophila]
MVNKNLLHDTQQLLIQLIECPSMSREEDGTAQIILDFFAQKNIPAHRLQNNIWASNKYFDSNKPTILLNSHHDTVKPNSLWTEKPYVATLKDEKLIGLGVNDAGASLVCLINTFVHFYEKSDLAFNLLIAASAEEEISGKDGIELLLKDSAFPKPDAAIVGEPTDCQMAIAEKGLMVVDAKVIGKAGHAARNEGINAIYLGMEDILAIRDYAFDKISPLLGPVKCTVTIANGGSQHNVVPELFEYTIDCRVNECYQLEEILEILNGITKAELTPRSIRLRSSKMEENHPLVQAGKKLGIETFGSPTLSDQALIPVPSIKIGPGHSGRSHTADEFIYLKELEKGLETYIQLLTEASIQFQNI